MTRLNAMERFEVGKILGRGGMGTVHQAFDNARGTLVALKRLQRVDPTSLLRFKTEFRILSDLVHPNLVALYELFDEDPYWFFFIFRISSALIPAWAPCRQ